MQKISIIIRTKNEERWISSCLKSVFEQRYGSFEVIIVDNESTDSTLAKVRQFPVKKVLSCTDYLPGKSLNIGIEEAEGDFIVCLSGHCIPTNDRWLENLYKNFDDPEVAGVYGRQEPLSFTPPGDKRDMMIVFGPERKVQRKDSFFHNANSMIRKEILHKYPFDDKITNIEDRIWAQQVLRHGYAVIYEPDASVYHWHGIHQNGDETRCQNVVRILESLNGYSYEEMQQEQMENLNVVAIIPVKEELDFTGQKILLKQTLRYVARSRYINSSVVSTDSPELARFAVEEGADNALLRGKELSHDYVGLDMVYHDALNRLENDNNIPDILVLLEITYPFRDENLIDGMVKSFVRKGFDTILPARKETNVIWSQEGDRMKLVDEGFVPRKFKKAVYVSYKGLCCVTRPEFVRSEEIFGDNIGVYKVENPFSGMEIRDEWHFDQVKNILSAA